MITAIELLRASRLAIKGRTCIGGIVWEQAGKQLSRVAASSKLARNPVAMMTFQMAGLSPGTT
jgi:hypothetical protein